MKTYGICEKGIHRSENQDAILLCQEGDSGLFIVADGVGSAANGAAASQYIIHSYQQWWKQNFLFRQGTAFPELFGDIKQQAVLINQQLYTRTEPGESCSTMVLLFLHQGTCGWLSCGDSRIYRCDRHGVRLITRDDVWENHPGAEADSVHNGKIMSAIGGYPRLEYSCATDHVYCGDVFLLCSDGIYKFVNKISIMIGLYAMKWLPPFKNDLIGNTLMNRLVAEAVRNDTTDNYSMIVVKV